MTSFLFTPLIAAGLLLVDCSPTRLVGNGSGTSSICGTVRDAGGAPVCGALVSIYKSDNIPAPSLGKRSSLDSVFTDGEGRFAVAVRENVTYNVIAQKGNDKCLKDSVRVVDTSETMEIGTLRLTPAGSLSGRVALSAGHDPRTVLILVYGTNTFAVPSGSDGAFTLKDMAAGRYRTEFRSTIAGYRTFDTLLTIEAGARDTLGTTIRLDYVGVQKVSMAGASWDSLLLKGCLRWHPVDTTQVPIKGYNVYQSSAGSPLTQIASEITDTSYTLDSLALKADTLFYFRINAVLATGDEGKAGQCTLNVLPRAWKKSLSMRWLGFPPDLDYYVRYMEAGFGRLFMVNEQTVGVLKVLDQATLPATIIHSPRFTSIRGIAVSNTGFFVANAACPSLSDSGTMEIFAFSPEGDSLGKKFDARLSGQECGLFTGIKAIDGDDFYFLWDRRIDRRSGSGALLYSSVVPDSAPNVNNAVYGSMDDRILFFHSEEYLKKWQFDVFSPDCVIKSSGTLPNVKIDNFVANRGHGTFFSIEKTERVNPRQLRFALSEWNTNGKVVSRLFVTAEKNFGAMFCCDEKGTLYVREADGGSIVCYDRK
jgi:hypothetical protein